MHCNKCLKGESTMPRVAVIFLALQIICFPIRSKTNIYLNQSSSFVISADIICVYSDFIGVIIQSLSCDHVVAGDMPSISCSRDSIKYVT